VAGLSEGQGNLDSHRLGADIADAATRAVAPGPAKADVQNPNFIAFFKIGDLVRVRGGSRNKRTLRNDMPHQRFGIMGGNDASRQAHIGEVFAVSIGGGIGQVRRAGKCEAISDWRRRVPFRVVRLRGGRLRRLRGDIF